MSLDESQAGSAAAATWWPRGVLLASSATPDGFDEADLAFLEAVARWVGMVGERAMHVEELTRSAAEAGYRAAAEQLLGALTPRQREIAALIARGFSNTDIARELVLEPGTIANHVARILGRLGFRNRTQVAAWAAELGLHHAGSEEPRRLVQGEGHAS